MSFGDSIGIAGLIVAFIGIAAPIYWPERKWVGHLSLIAAGVLGIAWVLELKQRLGSSNLSLIWVLTLGALIGAVVAAIIFVFTPSTNSRLTEYQRETLKAQLRLNHPGQKIVFIASGGSETLEYAKELRQLFVAGKWKPQGPIFAAPEGELFRDLQVSSSDIMPPLNTAAQDLINVLRFTGDQMQK